MPSGSSYTNWYNSKTGNSGIIHISKSYYQGPLKCTDYDHTIDITNSWALISVGGVNREVIFGTVLSITRWTMDRETVMSEVIDRLKKEKEELENEKELTMSQEKLTI